MTIKDIREEVDTFLFEGHDTSSISMTMTLLLLGMHQDIQVRCLFCIHIPTSFLSARYILNIKTVTLRIALEMSYIAYLVTPIETQQWKT